MRHYIQQSHTHANQVTSYNSQPEKYWLPGRRIHLRYQKPEPKILK